MMSYIESETIELKEKMNDSFIRETVAFLNTNGGKIYIGIRDDGTTVGVQRIDETLKSISDCITDQIEPSPRNEIRNEIIYDQGLPIIVVSVCKGIRSLYCIKKYGYSTKGCLVRIGTTCKEMLPEEIQLRYRQQFTDGDYMLKVPAKYAPLSFDMVKILLTSRGFHVNENAFEASYNLKSIDGHYNLLAEIMADQNMVPTIFVKFRGTDKTAISQRSDYGSQSIILGYQKLKDRLIAENICKTDTTIRPRIDRYLFDMDCANEALVNMLVHNDWTMTEPLVAFYSDRIVFTSHGGLPGGMTREDFFNGISRPRNATLMRIFLSLGIVEHTGHGIPTIVRKYGKEVFDIHDSYVDVTIPFDRDVMALMPQNGVNSGVNNGVNYGTDPENEQLTVKEKRVILELVKHPEATYEHLAKETGFSTRTISRILSSLTEKRFVERVGNRVKGYWKVIT